jgi:signal transduction histidine kinase
MRQRDGEMNGSRKESLKVAAVAILTVLSLVLYYLIYYVWESDIPFRFVYFLPGILACLFWGRKGIILTIFMAVALLILLQLSPLKTAIWDDFIGSAVILFAAVLIAELSERRRHLIGTLEAKVEERTQELSERNSDLEAYAHVVSHDLKGPLSAVISASDTIDELMKNCDDEKVANQVTEVASIILRSSLSAIDLINDLLGLAKAGQAPKKISNVEVKAQVQKVLEERSSLIEARGIKVITDDDLGTVWADPTHIYQLFTNLIGNAIEYDDNPNPEIRITHRKEDGAHHYRVRDNGPGIPAGEAEEIFLPLYRGRNGGTGLGLAIVKRIVEIYHGDVGVTSNGGACFDLTLKDF